MSSGGRTSGSSRTDRLAIEGETMDSNHKARRNVSRRVAVIALSVATLGAAVAIGITQFIDDRESNTDSASTASQGTALGDLPDVRVATIDAFE